MNDSSNLIENKKKYLLLQLSNLSEENIQSLNERYKIDTYYNVIEEVINYLKNNSNSNLTSEDLTNQELKNIEWGWTD